MLLLVCFVDDKTDIDFNYWCYIMTGYQLLRVVKHSLPHRVN